MSEDTPEPTAQTSTDPRAQAFANAISAANRLGMAGRADIIQRQFARYRKKNDIEKGSVTGLDFNDPDRQLTDFNAASPFINRAARQQGGINLHPGVLNAKANRALAENVQNNNVAQWEKPGGGMERFDALSAQAAEMSRTPTFDASYIANAQSQLANTIRSGLEPRLRANAARFGMSGGPAQAALSAAFTERAQAEIASSLSDFGMRVKDMENSDAQREMAFEADLIARKTALSAGIRDPAFLINLNEQLGGLMEALRSQHDAEELQKAQERANNSHSGHYVGDALQIIGTIYGGPAGGQLGRQLGDSIAGNKVNGQSAPSGGLTNFNLGGMSSMFGGGGGSGSSTSQGYTPPLGTSYNDSRSSLRL